MGLEGGTDLSLEVFAGLVTDFPASQIPSGASPDTQDTKFVQAGVATRPGLGPQVFAPIAGNPTVNYLKSFITQQQNLRMLALDSLGELWQENPIGTLAQINTLLPIISPYCNSTSLFTREYMAFGDGKYGLDLPRQWDDTNFDRVSQVGPGAPPAATDEVISFIVAAGPGGATQPAAVAISAGPVGAVESGNTVTIQTAAPHLLVVGDTVTLAGIGVAGYNGTFTVLTVIDATHYTVANGTAGLAASGGGTSSSATSTIITTTNNTFVAGQLVTIAGVGVAGYNGTFNILTIVNPTTFTYRALVGGLAGSGGGTAAAAGNIIAGIHKISVMFQTRQGYITAPAPPGQWTSAGGKRVVVTNIPIGPLNVVARILIFTSSGGASFFYIGKGGTIFSSNMIINDNTTTTVTVDFSDAVLLAATNADNQFRLIELAECDSVVGYSSRLFWIGERNKIQNFNNLTFDGGFAPPFGTAVPLGWTLDPVFGVGGALVNSNLWGFAWQITGNAGTPRGRISQSAFQDSNGVAILQPGTQYSVRFRIPSFNPTGTKTVTIRLNSVSSGGDLATAVAVFTTTSQSEYIIQFSAPTPSPIPSDLLLIVDGIVVGTTPTNFSIDNIQPFPTSQPFNTSLVRASLAENPEAYDGLSGFLQVNENDGFRCTAFLTDDHSDGQLRGFLYVAKEHSLWSTADDGVHEPSLWSLTQVSKKVGTPSPRGIGLGEDWFVIAHRTGLYISDGGEPIKISQEIQPTWDQISWNFGHTLWVTVDTTNKRIHVGVPLGEANAPNRVLMMDYRGLDSMAAIAETPCVHYSSYTGKLIARGSGRKWSIWTIRARSCALIERPDGKAHVFMGNGAGNGKIYDLLETNTDDDGVAIPSYYTTYFFPSIDQEQSLQMGAHRKRFTYMTGFTDGVGIMSITGLGPDSVITYALPPVVLSATSRGDWERNINPCAERLAFKFATGIAPGDFFTLQRFSPSLKADPYAPVRGT